jgi:hypothetical protein
MSWCSRSFNVEAHMMFKEQPYAAIKCAARWRDTVTVLVDACKILSCKGCA